MWKYEQNIKYCTPLPPSAPGVYNKLYMEFFKELLLIILYIGCHFTIFHHPFE
jgi:hypothetical protein